MEERIFHVLMREVCAEMGIKVEKLSYGWILQLSKDGKVRHVTGTRFDLNKSVVKDNLRDLDLTYIPTTGEKVDISWKHNLSGGAKPNILEKGELYEQIEQLAIRAGEAMNINFATIDIIETTDGSLYVLEINSGIGATIFTELVDGGTEIIKDIYRQAVKKLFQ